MQGFKTVWFWLLVLAIIFFLAFIIGFEVWNNPAAGSYPPDWLWIVLALGVVLFIISIALYAYDTYRDKTDSVQATDSCTKFLTCDKACAIEQKAPVTCNKPCTQNPVSCMQPYNTDTRCLKLLSPVDQ